MGTTQLVIDLKRRRHLNQDKLNYGLEIGARRFKCTTVPILREPYGIVGAICMNIDVNYIRDHVLASWRGDGGILPPLLPGRTCRSTRSTPAGRNTKRALAGKRHWRETSSVPDPLSGSL